MKKFTVFIIVAVMVVLSGCKKEQNGIDKSLSGTEWVNERESGNITLSFTAIQAVVHSGDDDVFYTYEYDYPTVTMSPESPDESDDWASLPGIISDNTMSVKNLSTQKTIGIFVRKQ